MLATALSASIVGVDGVPVRVEVDVLVRPARADDRRPGRQRRARGPRARARRASQLRLRGPGAPDHRQSRSGRPAEGGDRPRPGHGGRDPGRIGPARRGVAGAHRAHRRARARRLAAPGARRHGARGGGARRRRRRGGHRAGRERPGERRGGRRRRSSGGLPPGRSTRHLAGRRARSRRSARDSAARPAVRREDAPDLASVIGQAVGASRARDRRGRPPQPRLHRPAGRRQDPPGARRRRAAAAARRGRGRRGQPHPLRGGRRRPRRRRRLRRPFRAPHHTISTQALVGGGPAGPPRRGQPRASRRAASSTRRSSSGPMRSTRCAARSTPAPSTSPASTASSRCPRASCCSPPSTRARAAGSESTAASARCEDGARRRYQARLSGPMRDRLDLSCSARAGQRPTRAAARGATAAVAARVGAAPTDASVARQGRPNAELAPERPDAAAGFGGPLLALLDPRGRQMGLSLRRLHRAARVARTIADLEGAAAVAPTHLDEALQHRPKEAARVIGVGRVDVRTASRALGGARPSATAGSPCRSCPASGRPGSPSWSDATGPPPPRGAPARRAWRASARLARGRAPGLDRAGDDRSARACARAWSRDRRRPVGGVIVTALDDDYPLALRTLDPRPPTLFVAGDRHGPRRRAVAIVGTRRASRLRAGHRDRARRRAGARRRRRRLGPRARDRRGRAPRGARGRRPHGRRRCPRPLDRIYPPRHRALARDIVRGGGALVTEVPIGAPVGRPDFARRNRIIAGLAEAVVVVEAPDRSGALLTAAAAHRHRPRAVRRAGPDRRA